MSNHQMKKSLSSAVSSASPKRPGLTKQSSLTRLTRTISFESNCSASNVEPTINQGHSRNTSTESVSNSFEQMSLSETSILINERSTVFNTPNAKEKDFALEVPFVNISLDASLPLAYFEEDVLNTIQSLQIKYWFVKHANPSISPLDKNKLTLTRITGAMTNVIYKVEYPRLPSLLLRVYGPHGDSIIDREYELKVLARLSSRNIGPKLFGCFENGRFEQYLENSTTLNKDDIKNWKTSQRIARRMKELHSGVALLPEERLQGPTCWRLIEKWISTIDSHESWTTSSKVQEAFLANTWKDFKNTVSTYKKWLADNNTKTYGESLVFCHNDAQYGNLLFSSPVLTRSDSLNDPFLDPESLNPSPYMSKSNSETSSTVSLFPPIMNNIIDEIISPPQEERGQDSKLVVIDFEYAGPNPAVYDLANHLCEWMHNYNCNEPHRCFIENFPNKNQILNFLYSYVCHSRLIKSISIDAEVKLYYNALIKWRATVQLFWSVWAIVQSGDLTKGEAGSTNDKSEPSNTITLSKSETFEETGSAGTKYIIKTQEYSEIEHDKSIVVEDEESTDGVDIDSFDYLGFCKEKISVFWGDMLALGIIKDGCVPNSARYLDSEILQ